MRPFAHHNASSVDQAIELLKEHNGTASLMAGGTDLIGILKDEILEESPEALINLKTIEGLSRIEPAENELTLGALARLCDIDSSPEIQKYYPLLALAAHSVAAPEIRNMGTLGGNLCQETRCWYYRYPHSMGQRINCARKGSGPCLAVKGDNRYHSIYGGKKCFAVCPSDMALALAVYGGILDIAGPEGSHRSLPVTELYDSMGTTLAPFEMITGVRVPKPREGSAQGYIKFRARESVDFAIAAAACSLDMKDDICESACIVLGGVAHAPLRATLAEERLAGGPVTSETASAAAIAALTGAKPLRRNEFKVYLVKTLVERVLLDATGNKQ